MQSLRQRMRSKEARRGVTAAMKAAASVVKRSPHRWPARPSVHPAATTHPPTPPVMWPRTTMSRCCTASAWICIQGGNTSSMSCTACGDSQDHAAARQRERNSCSNAHGKLKVHSSKSSSSSGGSGSSQRARGRQQRASANSVSLAGRARKKRVRYAPGCVPQLARMALRASRRAAADSTPTNRCIPAASAAPLPV